MALAIVQAYAQRFVISPDGVSYLDLSDAVVTGEWSRLLNLYWSPLYPALIGIARAISGVGPEHEIPVMHAANVACFAAMIAAFEYMLISVLSLAAAVRGSMLSGKWAAPAAYAIFGCFALTMTPLELTTPDLLNGALTFLAFGALLRLKGGAATRHAVVLGISLGLAALSKSFMIPWAVVCFATLAFALRRVGLRPVAVAIGVWLIFVVPWTFALSKKAGRPTFGDAGRLTYAWFVNGNEPPSMGGVPPGARTARTDMILAGTGISVDTSYTDPMWADPAKWNALVVPQFRLSDQLKILKVFHVFYVENFAPLLFLIFLVAVAPRGSRRVTWWRGWIVYVPAIAGLVAYAMVVVTTRYVLPFVLSGTLMLLATLPAPRRLSPLHALFGLVIPVALEALFPMTLVGLSLVTAIIGGMLTAVLVPAANPFVWGIAATVGLFVTRILFSPFIGAAIVRFGSAALAVLFWRSTLAAIRAHRTMWFARRTLAALGLMMAIVFGFRLGLRLKDDANAWRDAALPAGGNAPWKIAQELSAHGITPGARIALVGPHAESYWARTARVHIVASVPRNRVAAFWQLSRAGQDSLLAEFAANGATVAVATQRIEDVRPDSSWTPVKYEIWIRRLK
jgi:hypothetical protein